jgi:hypothetical protein
MNTELVEQINKIRKHYASSNSKGIFISKKYKIDCAKMVLNEIDIDTLLKSTINVIPDSHQIFFDYIIFKSFIIPDLYDTIINYAINLIMSCIQKYGKIEIHVNMNTLSVSAYNRYKDCIMAYTTKLYSFIPDFPERLVAMHLYNIPSCIDTISQLVEPLIHAETRKKMIKYDNVSSEKAVHTILEIIHITSTNNGHSANNNLHTQVLPIQNEEHCEELA